MIHQAFRWAGPAQGFGALFLGMLIWADPAQGDQVEMLNGDRYVGRVQSLGSDVLVLQSEVLGTLRLPRIRISTVTLESTQAGPANNGARVAPVGPRSNSVAHAAAATSTNVAPDFSVAMRQLVGNSNVIQQVQQKFLADAGPEAQGKFNDLVGGLLSGRVGVNDLRTEARATLDQARKVRNELGEEGGGMLASYLAILEGFLKESEPAIVLTNAPATPGKPMSLNAAEVE